MEATIPGGWTPYSTTISKEAMDIFNKTKPIGVNYTPLAVSTQVVSGTNYRFFCNAQVVYPNSPNDAVITQIYKPLNGDAHITSITKV
jgi:hypothetical protein